MRTVRLLAARTLAQLSGSFTCWAAITAFLVASAALFARNVLSAAAPLALSWAQAVHPLLPVLCVLLTMRLWADDRTGGRIDGYLLAPVFERDLALGRFLGAWSVALFALALSLVAPFVVLPHFAPSSASWTEALGAFFVFACESAFFCAAGAFASVCFKQPAVAAAVVLLATVCLPLGCWEAAFAWCPSMRARFAGFPAATCVADAARNRVALAFPFGCFVGALVSLFACAKALACLRLVGRGARAARFSTASVVALAYVFAALLAACAFHFDVSFSVAPDGVRNLSPRTRAILSDAHGDVRITCFLSRRAASFEATARLLGAFQSASRAAAGVRLTYVYVDPHRDLGAAARLVQDGVPEGTISLARGSRRVDVPAAAADENALAAALLRLFSPARRETIYWTADHGEFACDSYDPVWGLSDFARDLQREGHRLAPLPAEGAVPGDCALVLVSGARTAFSRAETTRLDAYLRQGGRLLAFVSDSHAAGIAPLLAAWDVVAAPCSAEAATRTGADVVARDFGEHAVTRPLAGCGVVFARPCTRFSSVLPEVARAKDGTTFTPLVQLVSASGTNVLAAAVERGGGLSQDLSVRPTRMVVVGDPAFVSNGASSARGDANRAFALNAVSWLAGVDAFAPPVVAGASAAVDLDRAVRVRFLAWAIVFWPALAFVVGWGVGHVRRRLVA